jgi:hypothetical protein
MPTEYLSFTAL